MLLDQHCYGHYCVVIGFAIVCSWLWPLYAITTSHNHNNNNNNKSNKTNQQQQRKDGIVAGSPVLDLAQSICFTATFKQLQANAKLTTSKQYINNNNKGNSNNNDNNKSNNNNNNSTNNNNNNKSNHNNNNNSNNNKHE